jgi:dUTP pyrophosphatase
LKVALPSGHYGRLASRSGLALNHFIVVGAGVIDADYRGEVKVLLFNFGAEDFQV